MFLMNFEQMNYTSLSFYNSFILSFKIHSLIFTYFKY